MYTLIFSILPTIGHKDLLEVFINHLPYTECRTLGEYLLEFYSQDFVKTTYRCILES